MSEMAYRQWLWRKVCEFERAPKRFGIERSEFMCGLDLLVALTDPEFDLHVQVKRKRKAKQCTPSAKRTGRGRNKQGKRSRRPSR